jgi:hypothetical protein
MAVADIRNVFGGILVIAGGGAFAWAAAHYPFGEPNTPGPGAFPLGVALVAVIFGLAILFTGLTGRGAAPAQPAEDGDAAAARDLRAPAAVLGAIAAFALAIERLGFVPAVFLTTFTAALGSRDLTMPRRLALALAVALGCWAIFLLGLGMTMPAFRSPL